MFLKARRFCATFEWSIRRQLLKLRGFEVRRAREYLRSSQWFLLAEMSVRSPQHHLFSLSLINNLDQSIWKTFHLILKTGAPVMQQLTDVSLARCNVPSPSATSEKEASRVMSGSVKISRQPFCRHTTTNWQSNAPCTDITALTTVLLCCRNESMCLEYIWKKRRSSITLSYE